MPKGFSQEELLGRPTPDLAIEGAEQAISGKRVLVTGAAGSVGGPLVRLLSSLGPSALILLDNHEHTLFRLKLELGSEIGAPTRWTLADIRDRRKLEMVFQNTQPEVVFHLAAYKHVPLGEENPDQAVEVNLAGTRALLEASAKFGVLRFVYPSSDKAVYPTSVYGCTKRIAETMALAADRSLPLEVSVVRFVNIVGTRGSVIETLSGQIAEGRSLTLTDPGMTRYWITMQEAIRLLVQAAAAPESGAIYLPDTGPAINLAEMAARLCAMLAPGGRECPVTFIGPRPGERMHEILLSDNERATPSDYPGILRVTNRGTDRPSYHELCLQADSLLELGFRGELDSLRQQALELADSLR